ncbi:MAG: KH domain-containing protein [Thermofilaceae archaeon]
MQKTLNVRSSLVFRCAMCAYAGIPVPVKPERLGVIIGKDGSNKTALERAFNVILNVDSKTSTVYISPTQGMTPLEVMRARLAIEAISLGFSLEDALQLSDENWCFEVIDLSEMTRNADDLRRIKARIIGEEGKARRNIEQMAHVKIVVGEKTVGILGECDNVEVARKALMMLIQGRTHGTVYGYLRAAGRELKRKRMELWEKFGDKI